MSIPIDSPSSSLLERNLHTNVERRGLALGAARERTCRAASISRERQRRLEAAIDDWESEGGAAAKVSPASRPDLLRKLNVVRLSADLLRDDAFSRTFILNGLLLLIAGAGLAALLND